MSSSKCLLEILQESTSFSFPGSLQSPLTLPLSYRLGHLPSIPLSSLSLCRPLYILRLFLLSTVLPFLNLLVSEPCSTQSLRTFLLPNLPIPQRLKRHVPILF